MNIFNKSIIKPVIDNKNKLIMLVTPRASCTIYLKLFFENMNLLDDLKNFKMSNKNELSEPIHNYIIKYNNNNPITNFHLRNNYHIFKVVRNPYSRAISIISFIKYYLPKSINITDKLFNMNTYEIFQHLYDNNKNIILDGQTLPIIHSHCCQQYIENEEKYINEYIKVEDGLDKNINKLNLTNIKDINKMTAIHHTPRYENNNFLGLTPLKDIKQFPQNYKLFYNKDIKDLVEKLYKDDIEKYNYSFDDEW